LHVLKHNYLAGGELADSNSGSSTIVVISLALLALLLAFSLFDLSGQGSSGFGTSGAALLSIALLESLSDCGSLLLRCQLSSSFSLLLLLGDSLGLLLSSRGLTLLLILVLLLFL
jgi:hypothetical protein